MILASQEALALFSQRVTLLNSVPTIDIHMPQHIARQIYQLEQRSTMLFTDAMQPTKAPLASSKIGRNDLCPCGNGKKYTKCHGSQV
jgi:uncharacterized protein YecA (UPF0149 family)